MLASPNTPELHMAYARVLLGLQRYAEAGRQVGLVTRNHPDVPEAWLIQATLQLQENRVPEAEASAKRLMETLDTDQYKKWLRIKDADEYLILSKDPELKDGIYK